MSLQTIYQNPENSLNCCMKDSEETPDHTCYKNDIFGNNLSNETEDNCDYEDPNTIIENHMLLIEITRSLWDPHTYTTGYVTAFKVSIVGKMDSSLREKLYADMDRIHPHLARVFVHSMSKYI